MVIFLAKKAAKGLDIFFNVTEVMNMQEPLEDFDPDYSGLTCVPNKNGNIISYVKSMDKYEVLFKFVLQDIIKEDTIINYRFVVDEIVPYWRSLLEHFKLLKDDKESDRFLGNIFIMQNDKIFVINEDLSVDPETEVLQCTDLRYAQYCLNDDNFSLDEGIDRFVKREENVTCNVTFIKGNTKDDEITLFNRDGDSRKIKWEDFKCRI